MTTPRDDDETTTSTPVVAAAAPATPPPSVPPPAAPAGTSGWDGGRYSRPRRRRGWDTVAFFWGAVFVAVGLWFFATETLGLELPRIRWDSVWPVLLIALGLVVILRGMRERRS
jgi:cell wall-active antibiotic response 4TMS protein YvqF